MTDEVAVCRNTPIHILEMLAETKGVYRKKVVACNPNLPVYLLEKLAKEINYEIRANVAKNSNTPAYILDSLVNDPAPLVRFHVIQNENTSNITLFRLFESNNEKNKEIRLALVQRMLTAKNSFDKRKAINLIERYYSSSAISKCLADNINTSVETLEQLAEDFDKEISEKARKTLKTKFSVSSLHELNS